MGHPLSVTAGIALAVFGVAYLLCYLPRKNKTFDFDPCGKFGEFEPHAKRYQELAKLVLTLATASIAFLVNFLVNISPDQKNRYLYSVRLETGAPSVIACLCVSVASVLLFLLFENLFYEDYAHSKYTREPKDSRETYTGARYALN